MEKYSSHAFWIKGTLEIVEESDLDEEKIVEQIYKQLGQLNTRDFRISLERVSRFDVVPLDDKPPAWKKRSKLKMTKNLIMRIIAFFDRKNEKERGN